MEEQIVASILQVTSAEKLRVHLISGDNAYLELAGAPNFPDAVRQRHLHQNCIPFAVAPRYFQEAISTGRVVEVQDILIDPRTTAERDIASAEGYHRLVCYPLIIRGDAVGLLTCYYAQDTACDDDEVDFLTGVASLLALLIENSRLSEEREELIQHLGRLTTTCEKTGLYNRRYLMEKLMIEVSRSQRYNRHLSCLMFDIDGLKHINDVYGTPMGDFIIVEFAQLLKTASRESDIAVRYGGEAFVLIAIETTREGAVILGRRLLSLIEEREFTEMGQRVQVTCSLGIASMPHPRIHSAEELLRSTDRVLSQAKKMGKGKLSVFD